MSSFCICAFVLSLVPEVQGVMYGHYEW